MSSIFINVLLLFEKNIFSFEFNNFIFAYQLKFVNCLAKISFILDVLSFCLFLSITRKGILDFLTIMVDYFYFRFEFCQLLQFGALPLDINCICLVFLFLQCYFQAYCDHMFKYLLVKWYTVEFIQSDILSFFKKFKKLLLLTYRNNTYFYFYFSPLMLLFLSLFFFLFFFFMGGAMVNFINYISFSSLESKITLIPT